jgi:hypothetical protein
VAIVGLALVLLCVLLVTVATVIVRRNVRGQDGVVPPEVSSGAEFVTLFRVPNVRTLGLLDVSLEWVTPPGVHVSLKPIDGALTEHVVAHERGRHASICRRVTVEDVFGLSSLSIEQTWQAPFRVVPVGAPLSAHFVLSRASGEAWSHPSGKPEGDLIEMRAYAPGDSIRHVLWKTFARSRRLLVRVPERAVAPQPLSVAFLIAGEHDEPTAGVARVFVEHGLLGPDFIFAADGAPRPTTRTPEAIEQIIDSITVRGRGGASLDGLAGQIDAQRMSACVVFAPPVDGPWRAHLLQVSRRFAVPATVVIGVDSNTDEPIVPVRWRWLFEEAPERSTARKLSTLRTHLEHDGFIVRVIHRPSGRLV